MQVEGHRESLLRLRDVARRRAGLAMIVFAAAAAAALSVALALPPLYRATAVLAVDPGTSDPESPEDLQARLDTISQRVLSRDPLLGVARRFGLYPELAADGLWDDLVDQMKHDVRLEPKVTVDPAGRGSLVGVSLSYRGRDPETAARVGNALASLYVEQDRQLRTQRHAGRAQLLKQRLDEMKVRLDDRGERTDPRPAPVTGGADPGTLDRLGSQLRAVREDRVRALERRESLRKQLADVDPQNASSGRLDALRQELVQRRRKLTDRHPDVLQLQAEIAALDKESRATTTASAGSSGRRLQEALDETDETLRATKRDEALLSQEMEAVRTGRRFTRAPRRDFPAVQEVYGILLRRYEDAQLADSAEEELASRLRLLDAAAPPLGEAGPPRMRLMAIGLLGALALAVAIAAVAERLDRSFRHVDDLRAFTRVPVLVTVPAISTPADGWRRRLRVAVAVGGLAVGATVLGVAAFHLFGHGYWVTAALERGR